MMDEVDVKGTLAAIPLFGDTLDPRQLDHLVGRCRVVFLPAGALLMTEGDFADAMFAIVEGQVAVAFHDRRGEEHGVAALYAGDVVGEMALLTGARRNATVIARTDVTAIEITKATIEDIFARTPELIDKMGEVLAKRQAELDRMIADANTATSDMAGRIRRFFGRG